MLTYANRSGSNHFDLCQIPNSSPNGTGTRNLSCFGTEAPEVPSSTGFKISLGRSTGSPKKKSDSMLQKKNRDLQDPKLQRRTLISSFDSSIWMLATHPSHCTFPLKESQNKNTQILQITMSLLCHFLDATSPNTWFNTVQHGSTRFNTVQHGSTLDCFHPDQPVPYTVPYLPRSDELPHAPHCASLLGRAAAQPCSRALLRHGG